MEDAPNKEGEAFINDRTSKVVAIIDDRAQADIARMALTSTGFTSDMIEVFCGLEGEQDLDLKGEWHGYLHHVKRKLEHFMLVQSLEMDRYERALLEGRCVIQVHTDASSREQAHEMLKSSGGHFIHYYGLLTNEPMES